MVQYFTDKYGRGVIKIVDYLDGYIWDFCSQQWVPHPTAAEVKYDKTNYAEITDDEIDKIIGIWC